MNQDLDLTVSQFVDLFNQTMELAYPNVAITGELANLRVSKNRWVYFELKDEASTLKCFATVYQLPGPLEDGLILKVRGQPRLHNLYGFSLNVMSIQPAGEGSIKRAANLLQAKLAQEGLFDESRKRFLPYPPDKIGLITSTQSAAYADFIKILNARWQGLDIQLIDVHVQGENAVPQVVEAINQFNNEAEIPDILVIIRGGGSPEDLAAFSSEQVTRAVASSRAPTLVAIGHEVDISLAELAADQRASTPSNAAELMVPDKKTVLADLKSLEGQLQRIVTFNLEASRVENLRLGQEMHKSLTNLVERTKLSIRSYNQLLQAFNPAAVLNRGYAVVRDENSKVIRRSEGLKRGDIVSVRLSQGGFKANINQID